MSGFSNGIANRAGVWVWRDIMLTVAPAKLRTLMTGTLARYLSSSVVALCADTGSFLVLLQFGLTPGLAAAIGFSFGILVHWLVSSRLMFADCVAAAGPERRRQQVLFVATAMVGLVLTTMIVGGAASHALNPRVAKLVAIGVSFFATAGLRQLLVFGKPRAA